MKHLRKTTKSEVLLNLFDEVGDKMKLNDVLNVTGIENYNSLKVLCSYIRNSKHVADENRIDIRIKDGYCVRIG